MDSLSFTVESGEIVGYVGLNNAGKSTMIKMFTAILVLSSKLHYRTRR
ncbi:MAG TPA: ATP-binding cassette domain-containing protein [Anaerolineae bacterium]